MTTRLAVPTFVLFVVAAALASVTGAAAAETPPAPGSVTLPVERFEELLEAARTKPPDPPPPKVIPLPVSALPGDVARALAHLGDDDVRTAVSKAACTSMGKIEETE